MQDKHTERKRSGPAPKILSSINIHNAASRSSRGKYGSSTCDFCVPFMLRYLREAGGQRGSKHVELLLSVWGIPNARHDCRELSSKGKHQQCQSRQASKRVESEPGFTIVSNRFSPPVRLREVVCKACEPRVILIKMPRFKATGLAP